MKRKTKKKIKQAIFIVVFHIGAIAWLYAGIMTATILN